MSDPALPFLFAGFAVVFVAIGAYLVRLWRGQRRIDERLDRLEGQGDDLTAGRRPDGA